MNGMILAAGFGTRLWPLTIDRTKPAIPVLNRPLISYSVEYLQKVDIKNIVVNLHHQPESLREALSKENCFGCNILYSDEKDKILGTAGAIDNARHLLDKENTFIVINGKIITNIDLKAAIETHKNQKALATLVLRRNTALEQFSSVEIDERNWIKSFGKAPILTQKTIPFMFTGIQILEPEIFEFIPHGVFSHITTDVYTKVIAKELPVIAHIAPTDQKWYEFSTLKRYLDLNLLLAKQNNETNVIGTECTLESDVRIKDSVLWNKVNVGVNSVIEKSIIGNNVVIPPNSKISNSVIVKANIADLNEALEKGAKLVGENLILEIQS